MTFQRELLNNYKELKTPEPVGLGDGHTVIIKALGTEKIKFQCSISWKNYYWMHV